MIPTPSLSVYSEFFFISGNNGIHHRCAESVLLKTANALNGAAARKVQVGDIVIVMSYALMDFEEAKTFTPKIVFPDQNTNKIL